MWPFFCTQLWSSFRYCLRHGFISLLNIILSISNSHKTYIKTQILTKLFSRYEKHASSQTHTGHYFCATLLDARQMQVKYIIYLSHIEISALFSNNTFFCCQLFVMYLIYQSLSADCSCKKMCHTGNAHDIWLNFKWSKWLYFIVVVNFVVVFQWNIEKNRKK